MISLGKVNIQCEFYACAHCAEPPYSTIKFNVDTITIPVIVTLIITPIVCIFSR